MGKVVTFVSLHHQILNVNGVRKNPLVSKGNNLASQKFLLLVNLNIISFLQSNGTTVIIAIILSVAFSGIIIVTTFFLKRKNRNQYIEMVWIEFRDQKNDCIFQDFAEIAFTFGTRTNEMRNAIATINKCENFSEIGLSCSVNEINAGQSIEVSFFFFLSLFVTH